MNWAKIEHGIPIMPKRKFIRVNKNITRWSNFLHRLSVGDSFRSSRTGLHTLATQQGIKLAMRHLGNNRYRYWRIE